MFKDLSRELAYSILRFHLQLSSHLVPFADIVLFIVQMLRIARNLFFIIKTKEDSLYAIRKQSQNVFMCTRTSLNSSNTLNEFLLSTLMIAWCHVQCLICVESTLDAILIASHVFKIVIRDSIYRAHTHTKLFNQHLLVWFWCYHKHNGIPSSTLIFCIIVPCAPRRALPIQLIVAVQQKFQSQWLTGEPKFCKTFIWTVQIRIF